MNADPKNTFDSLLSAGLMILQMDMEAAFLNGKIKSEIYVTQPRDYKDGIDKICRLDKALSYGKAQEHGTSV